MSKIAKYTGQDMYITFAGTNISGQGRNLEISQSADEIDVTTYGSTDKEYIVGMLDRDASIEILDDDTSNTIRVKMTPGSSGTLIWYPLGTVAGKPKFTVGTAVVTEANISYPYDDAVLLSCSMRLSGAVTEGTA